MAQYALILLPTTTKSNPNPFNIIESLVIPNILAYINIFYDNVNTEPDDIDPKDTKYHPLLPPTQNSLIQHIFPIEILSVINQFTMFGCNKHCPLQYLIKK